MKSLLPPVISVRRVTFNGKDYLEYYIAQDNKEPVNFFLDQEQHEALKRAQQEGEKGSQKQEPPFALHVVGLV